MKLSILDQSPISEEHTANDALSSTIELAEKADQLGFTRYWVAEHHDMSGLASPAPDIMLAMIGSRTKEIRLGAGAVLLPHYKAYNVAERYNLLATLFPNRVDVGIGRAPGGSAEASMALSGDFLANVRDMPDKLDELLHFLHNDFPEGHLYHNVKPSPVPKNLPVPWLLGTSEKSAVLAAEKRMHYAFGHFMSDQDGPTIVKRYRDSLSTTHPNTSPKVIVAVSAICAETTEEAEELALSGQLWKIQQAKGEGKNGIPSIEEAKSYAYTEEEVEDAEKQKEKMIIGNPKEVKEQLINLQKVYNTEELMIVTITHSYKARKKSYQLIADEFNLQ
ncbi:LLM class flavin-dependent oxidoreductase [Oceanobacillus halotolerans]|uniref:LLM class flavin-dependent oxidoreductase n=1 Tax=Oceanobacillus halotolerans TaxID=2663380 RepID=UPI0013DA601D|nr:LLM class flavin-dependent oxidoreductase [Oceanobacillus halotolerans]